MPAYQVALCEDEPMDRDQLAGLCGRSFLLGISKPS